MRRFKRACEKAGIIKANTPVVIGRQPFTTKFGVRGIPTMLVFQGGEAKATKVGAVSKSAIVEWIKDSIA